MCGLELPIFRAVAAIIAGEVGIDDAHIHLMGRPDSSFIRSRSTSDANLFRRSRQPSEAVLWNGAS